MNTVEDILKFENDFSRVDDLDDLMIKVENVLQQLSLLRSSEVRDELVTFLAGVADSLETLIPEYAQIGVIEDCTENGGEVLLKGNSYVRGESE